MSPGGSSVASAPLSQMILDSRVSPAASLVSITSELSAGSYKPRDTQASERAVSPYNYTGADTVSWACRGVSVSVENVNKLDTRSEVHSNIISRIHRFFHFLRT